MGRTEERIRPGDVDVVEEADDADEEGRDEVDEDEGDVTCIGCSR